MAIEKSIVYEICADNKVLLKKLLNHGYLIGRAARNILFDTIFSKAHFTRKLVIVSHSDLGLQGDVSYEDICKRSQERGLILCTPEEGLILPLFIGELSFPCIRIGMAGVNDRINLDPSILTINSFSTGERTVDVVLGSPYCHWNDESLFAFVQTQFNTPSGYFYISKLVISGISNGIFRIWAFCYTFAVL